MPSLINLGIGAGTSSTLGSLYLGSKGLVGGLVVACWNLGIFCFKSAVYNEYSGLSNFTCNSFGQDLSISSFLFMKSTF